MKVKALDKKFDDNKEDILGDCPRIETVAREIHFESVFLSYQKQEDQTKNKKGLMSIFQSG